MIPLSFCLQLLIFCYVSGNIFIPIICIACLLQCILHWSGSWWSKRVESGPRWNSASVHTKRSHFRQKFPKIKLTTKIQLCRKPSKTNGGSLRGSPALGSGRIPGTPVLRGSKTIPPPLPAANGSRSPLPMEKGSSGSFLKFSWMIW